MLKTPSAKHDSPMAIFLVTNNNGTVIVRPSKLVAAFHFNSQLIIVSNDDTMDTLAYDQEADLTVDFDAVVKRITELAETCTKNFTWLHNSIPDNRSFLNINPQHHRAVTMSEDGTEEFPFVVNVTGSGYDFNMDFSNADAVELVNALTDALSAKLDC